MNDLPQIEPLQPGQSPTLLSASKGNQLIHAVNALLRGKGDNGVVFKIAKGGLSWEIDPKWLRKFLTEGSTEDGIEGGGGGSGNGNMRSRGTWSSGTTDYAEHDVVEWTSNNQIGLFIAASGISGNGGDPFTGGTGHWNQIARDFSNRIYVRNSASQYIDIDAANELITVTDGNNIFKWDGANTTLRVDFDDGGSVLITKANVDGKDLYVQEVGACDTDGSQGKVRAIVSDIYT